MNKNTEKRIGKIQQISFGFGGYQDAMLGLSVTLGSDRESWGVGDFKGFWGPATALAARTKARLARGVEGSMTP